MNSESFPYAQRRHLLVAGCLALVALGTAIIYEWHSTPYTMVLFLMGGSVLLLAAVLLFGYAVWQDLRGRMDSISIRRFEPGDIIYRQGDPAEDVFVVTKGQVEASRSDPAKGDVILGRLGVDEYFGETAILS